MHNYCTPHIIKENTENFLIHRYNYILLSQRTVYDKLLKPRQSFRITQYLAQKDLPEILHFKPAFFLKKYKVYVTYTLSNNQIHTISTPLNAK
jgi:hypothetical protein